MIHHVSIDHMKYMCHHDSSCVYRPQISIEFHRHHRLYMIGLDWHPQTCLHHVSSRCDQSASSSLKAVSTSLALWFPSEPFLVLQILPDLPAKQANHGKPLGGDGWRLFVAQCLLYRIKNFQWKENPLYRSNMKHLSANFMVNNAKIWRYMGNHKDL